jgi:hypothetical protein
MAGVECVECVGLVGAFWEEGGVVVDRDYARVCGGLYRAGLQ